MVDTKNLNKVAGLTEPENIETDVTVEENLSLNYFQTKLNCKSKNNNNEEFFETNPNEEFSIL